MKDTWGIYLFCSFYKCIIYKYTYVSFFFFPLAEPFSYSLRKDHSRDHWRKKTYYFYPVNSSFKLLNCIDGKRKMHLGYRPKQTYLPFNLSPFKGVAKKDAGFWQNSLPPYFLISIKIYCLNFLLVFLSF